MEFYQWQSLLKLGNSSYQEQQWGQAEYFYLKAYDSLKESCRNSPLSVELLMGWVCACHNLASLYETLDNLTYSLRFLMIPHEYVSEIANSTIVDEEAKLIAIKAMSMTISPILMFAKKYPMCEGYDS